MVAHAVYVSVILPASASEVALGSIVAIAGYIACRTAAEDAAGSSGRPDTVVVVASNNRGIVVAITRHGTVAVVDSRIMVAVAIGLPIAVAIVVAIAYGRTVSIVVPVVVAVVVQVSIMISIAMALGRVGLVKVMTSVETATFVVVAALEGHEDCGTIEEHPSDTITGIDGECPATGAPDDGTVEPLAGHEAVVLPGAEHEAQVAVAHLPPEAEYVGAGIYVE